MFRSDVLAQAEKSKLSIWKIIKYLYMNVLEYEIAFDGTIWFLLVNLAYKKELIMLRIVTHEGWKLVDVCKVGMTISQVSRVTRPNPPLLGRV